MTSPSFAAAQGRVQARRAARDALLLANQQSHDTALRESVSRLAFPFNRAPSALSSFLKILVNRQGTQPAFRVGQVDAELLDEELVELLNGQVGEALKYFGHHLRDDWSQEIYLALRASLFKLSIWDNDASYGASLQNLRYTDARKGKEMFAAPTRWQKAFYGIFTVLGRYGWGKWEGWLIDQEGGYSEPSENIQALSRLTSWISTTHSVAAFLSFLVFLVNGRYRTLTDRLLRIRLAPPTSQVSREVSFEYLNRQLVWHAFTEFLLFLLPLVGISRWRRWLARAWRRAKFALNSQEQEEKDEKGGPLSFLPERTCAICYNDQNPATTSEVEILGANAASGGGVIGSATTDVVNPYETIPCQCVYCFVCLAIKIEAEEGEGWSCLRCGEVVKKCRPWAGDVLERTHRAGGKSVAFLAAGGGDSERTRPTTDLESENDPFRGDTSQWSTIEKVDTRSTTH